MSIVGVISVMTVAKGLVIAPFINIVYNVLYAIISILQHYYGEAIIYIGLMIPVSIMSIVAWLKNKQNSSTVKVNKIHGLEYLYLFIVSIEMVPHYVDKSFISICMNHVSHILIYIPL